MLVSKGFLEGLAQHEADIFHGVMIVDFKIALRLDLDIEQPVARKDLSMWLKNGMPVSTSA